jgi:protein SCO1/2
VARDTVRPLLVGLALASLGVLVGTFPVWSPFAASSSLGPSASRGLRDEPLALSAFSFRSQHGTLVSERELRGHVWIANFIFTRCIGACPVLTAKLTALQRQLGDPRLRFVSFSVDPEHDTPELLASYAARWNGGESRWLLLSTDRRGIDALTLGVRATLEATSDALNPILHTTKFFLVDGAGSVRGVYESSDESELGRLMADAQTLASERSPSLESEAAAASALDR